MRRKQIRNYSSIQQCAAMRKVPPSQVKAWKRAGCPAFKGSRIYGALLDAWLAKQPANAPPPPKQDPEPIGLDKEGDAYALRRLEVEERNLHTAMQSAQARGDHVEVERLQKLWLEVLDQLRKMSGQVAEQRRVAVDMVLRVDVEKALWAFGFWTNTLWMQARMQAGVEIQRKAAIPTAELMGILDRYLRFGLIVSSAAALGANNSPAIPRWMQRSMVGFWDANTFPKLNEKAEAIADLLREVITASPAKEVKL
jgi:hypothetical protein